MSAKDDSSQFQFLISCIKNSNAGKVDFAAVADQLDIVSKGAAAKRYERLMKAHGIGPNGINGGNTPKKPTVKKEKGAAKPPAKKRKLEEVDENAGDEDEPVKKEHIKGEVKSEDVKCEVKFEDATNVKSEHGNGGAAFSSMAAPSSTQSSSQVVDDDDDDDVLVVSETQRSSSGNVSAYGGDHHHHHMHMSAQHIPGIHSFDYAANMGYPVQTAPTTTPTMTSMMRPMMARPSSGNPLPYGFAPSPYAHTHDGHNYFWQGSGMMPTHPDGGHREDSTDRG